MKSLSLALVLVLAFAGFTVGQTLSDVVARVRQIKLLESTREDVKRILHEYEATNHDEHYQVFSNTTLSIEVTYSAAICAEDSDEEDPSEIWNVKEWTVTRIEIELDEPLKLQDAGLHLSSFKKELRFPNDPDSLIFHNKTAGIAVKTTEDGIQYLIFFPPRISSNKLCRNSTAAKGFYKRKGWFTEARPYDYACILINKPANVEDVKLSGVEIDPASMAIIAVATAAIDPENDVLTYSYKVTAGKIIGQGYHVTWDLTGVAPGTYSITVGVDDGAGVVGKIVTKTVTIK